MKIPILDLKRQIAPIRGELDAAIKRIVDNAQFVFGREVDDLEAEVARYAHVSDAVGVSNGTDAIKLAILALGVASGEGVLCPAFTYYATASAFATAGAVPILVDIDPRTFTISVDSLKEELKKKRRVRIKAIVPVHLFGQCADMDPIIKIAHEYRLKIVEDTAQAFGAEYKRKKAGTLGDCGAVSFFPGKNLGAFGDAGMVLTHKHATADLLRILRNQGNKQKYHHVALGYNNRLDSLQAAVLRVKLKYIDGWNSLRAKNAAYFDQQLKGLPLVAPFVAPYSSHIYHQYVLRVPKVRDALLEHLNKKNIEARVYYPVPLHLQPCFKYLHYKKGRFPESEKAAKEVLAIPVYPDLTEEELRYIVASIREFFHA